MSVNLHALISDLITWSSAAKIVIGAAGHKIWSVLVGAEKKAAAEIEKLKADVEAAAKKI